MQAAAKKENADELKEAAAPPQLHYPHIHSAGLRWARAGLVADRKGRPNGSEEIQMQFAPCNMLTDCG